MEPDFGKSTGFDWDAGNSSKSVNKHRVTTREAEEAFSDPSLKVLDAPGHSAAELRWKAFGKTHAGRMLVVSFTVRGSLVRVISARPMNRKERGIYEQEATA
ncbi:MAG TPA: BrnT family toxin [Tepidisphaeraceae bacterium]|nr:BrnT family toxin [Tepidisphaeraceae bacterium]